MKVLITGAGGQLGRELQRMAPDEADTLALDSRALDVTDPCAVREALAAQRPDWVINAAAYTAVDRAESERARAFAVNAEAAGILAETLAGIGGRLLHVSTDFVFSGNQSRPYLPDDPVGPINVYGRSKAQGEAAVREALPDRHLIMRTAWLYAEGGINFVTTILRLMRERDELAVVDDQIGSPTRARGAAAAMWAAMLRNLAGTHHWTDAGVASWYDFACAIRAIVARPNGSDGLAHIRPVPASEFPTPARRPRFGVLDKTLTWKALQIQPVHWETNLESELRSPGR